MEKRRLGKTGYEVSVLGFGGAPIGILETGQQQIEKILNLLLDEGVNLIDTAAVYRGSEEAIGKAVSHRRSEYILVSKCGEPGNPASDAWKPAALARAVDSALEKLRTDHLDIMLLHSCGLEVLRRGDALGALVQAQEAGKIRHVGHSGDNEDAAYAVTLPEISVVETSVNICDQANIDGVLPGAREGDVGVIAKRPIANAAWKALSEQEGFYQEYASTYSKRLKAMGVSPRDLGFQGDAAGLWPEIALRFTLSQPGVHTAIIGTTRPEHARANLEAVARGPLPEEAVKKLRDAFRAAESAAGGDWTAQT